MVYCSGCGELVADTARFCPACGTVNTAYAGPAMTVGGVQVATPPQTSTPSAAQSSHSAQTPIEGGNAARWILPVIVVVSITVIAVLLWSQRDGALPIASTDRTVTSDESRGAPTPRSGSVMATSAAALDTAFVEDPRAAAERYPGPIEVTGTIATMVTPGATPALSLEGRSRFNFLIVNFPVGYRERLSTLAKGDRITVRCDTVKTLGGSTMLSGCEL